MTVEDYRNDPDFVGFVSYWIENKRCPLEFVDWLIERDLLTASEAARWAATEPDRPIYADGDPANVPKTGPMPAVDYADNRLIGWYWFVCLWSDSLVESDNLPDEQVAVARISLTDGTLYYESTFDAIVGLLTRWVSASA